MNSGYSHFRKILFLIILTFGFSGCGVWDSFTTYFNLYYNTKDIYEKAEEQILTQQKELFSTEPPVVPGAANTQLVKVIEKCSQILQFHTNTGYVEDALMMLGKSFYYQKNYQKSERQFEQLIDKYPESDFLLEAKLWTGKCKMRLRNYDEGLAILAEVREEAVQQENDDIIKDAFIEEIVYRITTEDISGAVDLANEFLQVTNDDEIKADVWYEVGNLNMKIDKVQEAITAYNNVFEYSPDFDLEVEAKIKYGQALREGGETEKSHTVFEDMLNEDKYSNRYSDIQFELGKSLSSLGRFDEAISELLDVDTTYKSSPVSGAAKYEIGKIYEEDIKNLDSAASFYKSAATSTLPPGYVSDAKQKNQLLSKYILLRNNIQNYNKQLFYLQNPDEFVKDSTQYVQDSLAIAVELRKLKELQSIWGGLDSLLTQTDTTGYYADTLKIIDSLIVRLDSMNVEMVEGDTTLNKDSILVHLRKPVERDSTVIELFDSLFTYRELDPKKKFELQQQEEEKRRRQSQLFAELPDTMKFKNNPPRRPKIPIDSVQTLISGNELEVGNLFLTELNIPDSAYWYYDDLLKNYPNTIYEATALYSLGSYFLTVNEKQRADSLFNIIYENYRNESIVNAAADKLDKPFVDLKYDPAEGDYSKAEEKFLDGNHEEAVKKYFGVFKKFPESSYAPKALYTSGLILEDNLFQLDSAAAVFDTLVANYPTSEFVKLIAPRLTLYKQEQHKLELAKEDSLYALEKIRLDSLHADSLNNGLIVQNITTKSDTVNVALNEELPSGDENNGRIEPVVKQNNVEKKAIWNPRIRQ
jgi:TolA-binding protein